eukprot:CAMPEP_0119372196 /NCGR_PEP_ID=MMETSP1334-20130426/18218_1 /TAXON_ID=127549 /ORGANISM="Calcidiscus leptoporus, Strain RCC1130" /LENGTH=82 /DNA_ID=CAMNT_0007389623 /DNA_START=111 /DNA_END=356 /DNA_ORIENTATION=-
MNANTIEHAVVKGSVSSKDESTQPKVGGSEGAYSAGSAPACYARDGYGKVENMNIDQREGEVEEHKLASLNWIPAENDVDGR